MHTSSVPGPIATMQIKAADPDQLVFQVEHPSGPWNQPLVHRRQRAKRGFDDEHRQRVLRVTDPFPTHGHPAQQRDG